MTDWTTGDPDPTRPEREPVKCWRHQWAPPWGSWATVAPCFTCGLPPVEHADSNHWWTPGVDQCSRCNRFRDAAASRRSRNNKNRGLAIQRKRIEGLGGTNLAGNNQNLDGIGLAFAYESKSGPSAFSERAWKWLKGIPTKGDQAGVLIVTDTPGPGRRARSYVVVDYDDWRDEHGETK